MIGGVIGTNLVRYDIYGKDVLIANKMESGGEPGRIMISESTLELVMNMYPNKYIYTFNQEVNINAIDSTVKGFFVDRE